MGKTAAYECDGLDCHVMAARGHRQKGPDDWLVITLATKGDKNRVGAFHTRDCAIEWVEQELGFAPAKTKASEEPPVDA